MRTETAFVGARVVDSYPFSTSGTKEQAVALKTRGVEGLAGYLGVIDTSRLRNVIEAGLAFMPLTLAGEYFNGPKATIARAFTLNLPKGCTIWMDLEGNRSFLANAKDLSSKINEFARALILEGYIPGLYVGSPQPLTGDELASLAVTRYWCAPSLIIDRAGRTWSEPTHIGFCMRQVWPQGNYPGTDVFVDVNMVGQDRKGRLPTWVVA